MKNSYQVLHEKTLCNRRAGVFSEQAHKGEGIQAELNVAASSVKLTAKAGKVGVFVI